MMEQRREEWDTGKPGPVSWKAMAGINGHSWKCIPRGAARLALGWATLSELQVHFGQPHLTSVIFHYSPTVLPRGKRCHSSNLSPIDWPEKGTRSPGCQAHFLFDKLPFYPNQVTRCPHSAMWHQRLWSGLQPEWGIHLGGKAAAGNEHGWAGLPARGRGAVWLLGTKPGELRAISCELPLWVWANVKPVLDPAHPRPGCTEHGSLQGQSLG